MSHKVGDVLVTEEEIKNKIYELGRRIAADYKGKELIVICVLKGAVVFLSDLIREINADADVKIDFLAISSYGASTKSSGVVRIQKDLSIDIQGKDVLVVEDILDTGLSLSYILKLLEERSPASLSVCVLLDKPERRKQPIEVKYRGFIIPDEFVIGYGLDCNEKFRQLPSIHVAAPVEQSSQ